MSKEKRCPNAAPSRSENRRKQEARRRRAESKPMSFRRLIGLAAIVLGAVGALGLASYIAPELLNQRVQATEPFLQDTEQVGDYEDFISDEEIIQREIKVLGIKVSEVEKNLWQEAYDSRGSRISPTIENEKVILGRLQDTLSRMRQSENPYYVLGANNFTQNYNEGKLHIMLDYDKEYVTEGNNAATLIVYNREEENLEYALAFSPDYVLNASDGLTLANTLIHELEHFDRNRVTQDSFFTGGISEEKVYEFKAFLEQPDSHWREEAFTYGKEAQAFIHQTGLTGNFGGVFGRSSMMDAANFIKFGQNPEDSDWQNYLQVVHPYVTSGIFSEKVIII